jgi:hypothetical protein
MICCGSKNDFYKKSGGLLFSAKVQKHPGSTEIGRKLHKIQKIPLKGTATKRELICVSQGVYYLCGVFYPAFDFAFRELFHKRTLFRHSKNRKGTFCGTKQKSASVAFLSFPRATRVADMASFRQTMPCSWPNLAHLT